MKKQAIALMIQFDDKSELPPEKWDWAALLDIAPSRVQLIYIGDVLANTPNPTKKESPK